ncbi:MAG: toll/interleukin-1 receptor domain-containing protein [Hyphomicrobiaceae bacterium]
MSIAPAGPGKLRVFISYARRDGQRFADWLERSLQDRSFDAYIDRKDIAPGEPWERRLQDLIRSADAVIFIVTPAAVASKVCAWEAEEAAAHGKRILPAVLKAVPRALVPAAITEINDISFACSRPWRRSSVWACALDALCAMLSDHVPWLRAQTRYEQLALDWLAAGQPDHKLLPFEEVIAATAWQDSHPKGFPAITPITARYLTSSRSRTHLTTDEAIIAHEHLASRGPEYAAKIAGPLLIHCLREGLPLQRPERLLGGDPRAVYFGIIREGPTDVAVAAWERMAELCEAAQSAPEGVDCDVLLRFAVDAERIAIATAAARILRVLKPSKFQVNEIASFLDPMIEPRSEHAGRWPQHRGHFALFCHLLDVVLAAQGAEACNLLHGAELVLGSDAGRWVIYYRALLREGRAGRINTEAVRHRFADGIKAASDDVEQAIGIAEAVTEQGELEQAWSGVALELAVVLRRHRQHLQRPDLFLGLLDLLTPIQPKGAFLQLVATAGAYAGGDLQRRAARALACAAQTKSDLRFLVDRFVWETTPAAKSLLFQALVEAPAEFETGEAGLMLTSHTQINRSDRELVRQAVRQLSESVQGTIRRALLSDHGLADVSHDLQPGLLAQTLLPEIEGAAGTDPEAAFSALTKLLALAVPGAINRAIAAGAGYDPKVIQQGATAAEIASEWERFCVNVHRPDASRQAAADAVLAQFNWLRARLEQQLAGGDRSGGQQVATAIADATRSLDAELRAWFVRYYDVLGIVQQPMLPAYWFRISADPHYEAIDTLLHSPIASDVMQALEGKTWQRRLAQVRVATSNLRSAEAQLQAWQLNEQVETILHAMVRVLRHGSVPGGDSFLMRMLTRTGTRGSGGETFVEHERHVADALAVAYADNPMALVENVQAAALMDETKVLVLSRLQARTRAVGQALSAQLASMIPESAVDPASLAAFDILSESEPRRGVDLARQAMRGQLSDAARARLFSELLQSTDIDDEALAFRIAATDAKLRHSSIRRK